MKKITLLSALLAASLFAAETTCTVKVANITKSSGKISIGVFNSKKTFPKQQKRFLSKSVSIEEAKKGVTFSLPSGSYAIGVYHDVNNNNKLDKNPISVPKEPYGFSNNKYGVMGKPDFKKSQFFISDGTSKSLTIKLR